MPAREGAHLYGFRSADGPRPQQPRQTEGAPKRPNHHSAFHPLRAGTARAPIDSGGSVKNREGEILVEYARGKAVITAHTIPGFWVRRDRLNPEVLPEVTTSLATVLAGVSAGSA